MKIVCIVGRKRSGKDTIADIILENTNSVKYALADPIKDAIYSAYTSLNMKNRSGVDLSLDHFYGFDLDGNEYDRESPVNISNKDASELFKEAIKYLSLKYKLVQGKSIFGHELKCCHSTKIELICEAKKEFWSVRKFMQTLGTDIVVNYYDEQFWNRCMMTKLIDNQDKKYFIVSDIRQKHEIELMRNLGALIIFVERYDINNTTNDSHITEQGLIPGVGDVVIQNNGTIVDLQSKLKKLEVI